MSLSCWGAPALARAATAALLLGAAPALGVIVEFNPVTVFPTSESSPDLALSLTATTQGGDCGGGLLGKLVGGLTFALEEPPGGATAGVDFLGGSRTAIVLEERPGGALTFEFQVVLAGVVRSDTLDEPDEPFVVRLSGHTLQAQCQSAIDPDAPVVLSPGPATVVILDDDLPTPAVLQLESAAYQADDDVAEVAITVVKGEPDDGSCGDLRVRYRLVALSAEPGDFSAVADGVVVLGAGAESASFPVAVVPDADGDDETLTIELFDPRAQFCSARLGDPRRATLTLRDTGGAPETVLLRFAAAELAVAETAGSATVEVTRAPATGAVQVTVEVAAGSAEAGDFEAPASQVLDFPEGTTRRTVEVVVHADDDSDPETLELALSKPVAVGGGVVAALGSPATATLTLTDQASPPTGPSRVAFAAKQQRVAEGDGRIRVRLVRDGVRKPAFRAHLALSGSASAGADFVLGASEVDFAEGATEGAVEVELIDDRLAEGEEQIEIALASVEGGGVEIGHPAATRLRIAPSDQGLSLEADGEPPTAAGAGDEVELAVLVRRIDGSPAAGVGVHWSLEASGAASGELLDGAETVTDAAGRAGRRLRIGAGAGELVVRAAIGAPPEAQVLFALAVSAATLPPPPPGVPLSPAAPAIDRLCGSPEGYDNPLCTYLFASGLTAAEQRVAVEELSGRETTALGTAALAGADEHRAGVRGRLAALRGGAAAAGELALQLGGRTVSSGALVAAVDSSARRQRLERRIASRLAGAGRGEDERAAPALPAVSKPRRWGLFASGRAAFGEKDATAREPGFEFDSFALTVGLDRRLGNDWVVGAALGLLDAAHDLADGGELGVAARDVTLFGLWQRPSGFYAQASGTWGSNTLDLERRVALPRRQTEVARAGVDGRQLALALELGLGRELGAWSVSGFARASRVAADLDGYRESSSAGGSAVPLGALEVADQGLDSLLAEAGVDLAYTAHLRLGLLRPLLRASLLHEAEDGARAIRSRLLIDPDPTNTFLVPTDRPDRDWASAGVGLQLYTLHGSFFLLCDRELARADLETTRVTLGFRREF